MLSGCTVLPDSKKTKLGSSNLESFPWADRNTGVVLVPCCIWKDVPTAFSDGVDISEVPLFCLLQQISSQWGSQELLQVLVFHELTAYLCICLPIFNSQSWITQIWITTFQNLALRLFEAFVQILLNVNLSLNQTLLKFLLCVRQTCILAISLWRGCIPLIQKDSFNIHGLAVYMKAGLPFLQENSSESYFSNSFTSLNVLLLFPFWIMFFMFEHSFLFLFLNISYIMDILARSVVFCFW